MTQQTHTPIEKTSARTMRVEREFDAPRDLVFRAMTEPDLLSQWWGRGNPLTVERLEPETGGHWRFVEHADGKAHGFEGRFREVRPPEFISMTFGWDGMPGYFQFPVHYGNFTEPNQFETDLNVLWGAPILIGDVMQGMPWTRQPDGSLIWATAGAGNQIYRGHRLPADLVGDYLYGEVVGRGHR